MVDLSQKQQEALQDTTCFAISEYLRTSEKPQTLGEISRGIELRDLAKVHYHLMQLVDVDLVEKVPGTRRYRLVGGE
ncbi:MAG TPA: helix-turn-helix domain-containing protein [Solirubrobacterales bacterium]